MVNATLCEVLIPSAKCDGLSYPTHFFEKVVVVLLENVHKYRTKQTMLFARQNYFHALCATNKAKRILNGHFTCSCSDTINSKSIKKNRKKSHF